MASVDRYKVVVATFLCRACGEEVVKELLEKYPHAWLDGDIYNEVSCADLKCTRCGKEES